MRSPTGWSWNRISRELWPRRSCLSLRPCKARVSSIAVREGGNFIDVSESKCCAKRSRSQTRLRFRTSMALPRRGQWSSRPGQCPPGRCRETTPACQVDALPNAVMCFVRGNHAVFRFTVVRNRQPRQMLRTVYALERTKLPGASGRTVGGVLFAGEKKP